MSKQQCGHGPFKETKERMRHRGRWHRQVALLDLQDKHLPRNGGETQNPQDRTTSGLPGSASPLHSGQTAAGSRAGSRKPRSSIYGISCPWGLFFPDLWHLKGHLKHQCTKSTALPKAFLAFPQTIFIAAHVLAVQSPSETCFPPHLQHLAWQSILSWGCGFLVVCVCTRVL